MRKVPQKRPGDSSAQSESASREAHQATVAARRLLALVSMLEQQAEALQLGKVGPEDRESLFHGIGLAREVAAGLVDRVVATQASVDLLTTPPVLFAVV